MKAFIQFVLICFFASFFLTPVRAADYPPKKINLQAVLLDAGGNVMLDLQQADITFSVVDGSGAVHYQETQNVAVVSGALSVLVGDGIDPATGTLTGGIPYAALDPSSGTRMLRMQLSDQSVPQEDFEMVSVPYSYYSQFAVELVEPIETTDILDGTITQADLSADLLTLLTSNNSSGTTTTSTTGTVNATDVLVQATFENMPSGNLLGALQGADQTLTLQTSNIESILTGGVLNDQYLRIDGSSTMLGDLNMGANNIVTGGTVDGVDVSDLQDQVNDIQTQVTSNDTDITNLQTTDTNLQNEIDAEETARAAEDTNLQNQITSNDTDITNLQTTDTNLQNEIDAEEVARAAGDSNLQNQIDAEQTARLAEDSNLQNQVDDLANGTTLDDRYVNESGDTMDGDLAMNDSECQNVDKDGDGSPDNENCLVDGVDVSSLDNQVTQIVGGATLDGRYVNASGDTMTGALTMQADINMDTGHVVDGIDIGGHVHSGGSSGEAIDHNNLNNRGSHSHSAIDSHINDGSTHFTLGSVTPTAIGAASSSHSHSASQVGAAPSGHNHNGVYADVNHSHSNSNVAISQLQTTVVASGSHSCSAMPTEVNLQENCITFSDGIAPISSLTPGFYFPVIHLSTTAIDVDNEQGSTTASVIPTMEFRYYYKTTSPKTLCLQAKMNIDKTCNNNPVETTIHYTVYRLAEN